MRRPGEPGAPMSTTMESARRLIARTRRRLHLRQAVAAAALLMAAGCGLGFVPLLIAKWRVVDPLVADYAFPVGLVSSALLAGLLAVLFRPSTAEAARRLDDASGGGEVFLSSVDDGLVHRGSQLQGAYLTRLGDRVARTSAADAVPIGGRTALKALALLLCVDVVLALTPHRQPPIDPVLGRLDGYLATEDATELRETERDAIRRLRNANGRKDLRATAETLWRERVAKPSPSPSAAPHTDPAAPHRNLLDALARGDFAAAAAAARNLDGAGGPGSREDRERLAAALERAAATTTDAARADTLREVAKRLRRGGAGDGLAATLASIADTARRPEDARSGRLREILLTVFATLGSEPPATGDAGGGGGGRGPDSAGLPAESDRVDPMSLPARYHPLIRRYFSRRASRRAQDD